VEPEPKLGQRPETTAKADKMAGSRSAPIETSPRTKFQLKYQRVEADRRWGPTSVLIHNKASDGGPFRFVVIQSTSRAMITAQSGLYSRWHGSI
jgi:hypothetical protein